MNYIHPTQLSDAQRRENTAAVLDRFARAHERVAAEGRDSVAQRESAANARRVAANVRKAGS